MPSPFRLRVFGGLALEGGPAVQRKRLALLAVLAAAGPVGVSRERLLSLFWPESDTAHARHSLKQAVYGLRRVLGETSLQGGPTELVLDAARVGSDVHDFERCLAAGDLRGAVAHYGGPLLDGVHLADAPGFERWVEQERALRARRAAAALEQLASAAMADGDRGAAVRWWQQLAALDPLDSRVAREVVLALDAAGDRAGALRHARVHEALLREELDLPPDPAIRELVERLRTAPARAGPPAAGAVDLAGARVGSEPVATGPPAVPTAAPGPWAVAADAEVPVALPASVPRARQHRWRSLTALATAGALVLVLLLVLAAVDGPVDPEPLATDAPALTLSTDASVLVAVLPFEVHGGPERAYLRDALADLLSRGLDGAGDLRSVEPQLVLGEAHAVPTLDHPVARHALAARLGAAHYVVGSVVVAAGRLRIAAALHDGRELTRVLAAATVEGPADSVFALVDALATQLLTHRRDRPADHLVRTAALTTGSLAAFKSYLRGEMVLRAGRTRSAIEAFQQAVAADSTFALAYYRLSIALTSTNLTQQAERALRAAQRHAARLSARDQLRVEALVAAWDADTDRAEMLYRRLLSRHPDDIEAQFKLADLLFHQNPYRGRSIREARPGLERAVGYAVTDHEAVDHLVVIAALECDRTRLDTLATRIRRHDPTRDLLASIALYQAACASPADRAVRHRAVANLAPATDWKLLFALWRVGALHGDAVLVDGLARMAAEPGRAPELRAYGALVRAHVAHAGGRHADAHAALAEAARDAPLRALEVRAHWATLPFDTVAAEEVRWLRDSLARWDPARAPVPLNPPFVEFAPAAERATRPYLAGLLSARLGEGDVALAYADTLERLVPEGDGSEHPRAYARSLAEGVRARVAWERGEPAVALGHLERGGIAVSRGFAPAHLGTQAPERYLRALALHALGRELDAVTWYASMAELAPYAHLYAAPAELALARIAARRGDTAGATAHRQRAAAVRRAAGGTE